MAFDVVDCIADVWFRLGFSSAADMAVSNRWVTIAELYQFADEAVKGLARTTALFLGYDVTIAVVAGTASYALPARHVFTEGAWLIYSGGAIQLLRLTGTGQLFALDATWSVKTGLPTRLSLDAQDVDTCILYPSPVSNSTLAQVLEIYPPDVADGASVLPVSAVLQDAVSYAMLAGALSKESDSARPEVAAHCKERMLMYAAIAAKLWGKA